jgi:hypothetical protein
MSTDAIPLDVLLDILEHVDKATLVTMCKLNKVCCPYSQDVLYREILIHQPSECRVYKTLAKSTHLARRVRSFNTPYNGDDTYLHEALQNMINLRRLDLRCRNSSNYLEGCTFKLVSFSSTDIHIGSLYRFLSRQPSLMNLSLDIDYTLPELRDGTLPELRATFLPNLTRITAPFSELRKLIPNRPVKGVVSLGKEWESDSVDFSFFTLSNSPIQKLEIDYSYLYPKSGQYLASIFPSLTHLEIIDHSNQFLAIVRESPPFYLFIPNRIVIDPRRLH